MAIKKGDKATENYLTRLVRKSVSERQIPCDLTYKRKLMNKTN